MIFHGKEDRREKPKYVSKFSNLPCTIIRVGPKGGGGGGRLSIFVFRMRWEHLSFAMCFVFGTIMLGLEPDDSAQSLECQLLESSHSDHLA